MAPPQGDDETPDALRVLVVDDEPQIRTLLRGALERAGYRVEEAANGRHALASMAARPCEVVVTDIYMPETEGIETIMKLRRDHPDAVILAMSGGGTAGGHAYLEAAQRLGADATLAKPFTPRVLLETLSRLLGDDDARERRQGRA